MNLADRYRIKGTVDIYIIEESDGGVLVKFRIMTTRKHLTVRTNQLFVDFISMLDGRRSCLEILDLLSASSQEVDFNQVKGLIGFLLSNGFAETVCYDIPTDPRYDRQINFFDDFISSRSGLESQKALSDKNVILFGVGAVNSQIAEILVRCGVKYLTLVDYKNCSRSTPNRHSFWHRAFDDGDIPKIRALSNHLLRIDSSVTIRELSLELYPDTDLSVIIDNNCDLVINGCDEPYIGHTSLKLGRYLQQTNTALYVSGGFNFHLMSSGELVFPPKTPCIDCIQNSFQKSLANWKPVYLSTHRERFPETGYQVNFGGVGGLAVQSCFSANLSSITILRFLIEGSSFEYQPMRYEYLINKGNMTAFSFKRQESCSVCNKQV